MPAPARAHILPSGTVELVVNFCDEEIRIDGPVRQRPSGAVGLRGLPQILSDRLDPARLDDRGSFPGPAARPLVPEHRAWRVEAGLTTFSGMPEVWMESWISFIPG